MAKLTKTVVDKATAGDTDVWIWDDEVPGFGIRIQPSGRKTYVTRYRNQDGIQRKKTVARCSDMPPDKARDLARKVFMAVAEGRDPTAEKEYNRNSVTMENLRDRYMKEHANPFKKKRSAGRDEENWRLHILPALGAQKKVKSITQEDILALVGGLSMKRATANQCLALISKAMNLAETWKYRSQNSNPCKGVKKYKIEERETILSPEEIGNLVKVMDELVDEGEITKAMVDLVHLLLLTGCRLNEIMSSPREWVDETRGLLLLTDSKVGQRRIPLSPPALAIIAKMPKEQKWLIPGRVKGAHLTAPYDFWKAIKDRAGLPKRLRLHDLRHTAGSLGHAAGLSQKQIATMLGHKQLSTTERYLHGLTGEGAEIMGTLAGVVTSNWTPAADSDQTA